MMTLAAKGATVTDRNNHTQTPLMLAVSGGHIEAVKWLLNNGANPGRKNQLDQNSYKLAEATGNQQMISLLESYNR